MRKNKPAISWRPAAMVLSIGALAAFLASAPLAADQSGSSVRLTNFSYEGIVRGLLLLLPPAGGGGPSGRQPVDPEALLTADQNQLLIPAVTAMKTSAFPSPSTARQILRSIDSVLTPLQKRILAQAEKESPVGAPPGNAPKIGVRPVPAAASARSQTTAGQTRVPRGLGASSNGSIEESRLAMVNFLFRRISAVQGTDAAK
ncbi:MAG TPA: hypothetical protein VMW87_05250 [Spirochaetia bacterium]|nr:hypothetical protein [Spirochaetia bacterium]